MTSTEGVIKFQLEFTEDDPLPDEYWKKLNILRDQMFSVGLIGKDPKLYGGYSYGNVSQRLKPGSNVFVICGSQTGGIPVLNEQHYTMVDACDFNNNRVVAHGPIEPSSESLTHGIIYELAPDIHFVIHAHSPEIWNLRQQLGITCTSTEAKYGTLQLVQEVGKLTAIISDKKAHVFAMDGHKDGIVSFGKTREAAAVEIMSLLNDAQKS